MDGTGQCCHRKRPLRKLTFSRRHRDEAQRFPAIVGSADDAIRDRTLNSYRGKSFVTDVSANVACWLR